VAWTFDDAHELVKRQVSAITLDDRTGKQTPRQSIVDRATTAMDDAVRGRARTG